MKKTFDVNKIRRDFPILNQIVNDKPLVYLDNAATTQKPKAVLASLEHYYSCENANVHRGLHTLSTEATAAYEGSRETIKNFIHAKKAEECIFVRGTTEAINLVANCFGQAFIKPDDEIIISTMEHHSNIVPWQLLCERTGAKLRVINISDDGELELEHYSQLFNNKTKFVSVAHISNALGTINPIKNMIDIAHSHNCPVLIDGAQAIAHMAIDVQALDCDFYAFSAHKCYGPTGIGVLYAKEKWLAQLPPYQGGGDMINQVSFEKTTYAKPPYKFEAGTPNIAGAIGMAAAIDYLSQYNIADIAAHENNLLAHATEAVNTILNCQIVGTAKHKASVLSFVISDIHAHDVGTILDQDGVAVRAGHHCAMPIMTHYNIPATVRASFAMYNTMEEVEQFIASLQAVRSLFA